MNRWILQDRNVSITKRCEARIKKPNGDYVVSKESLLYLGSFLCDNGSIGPELNRRLALQGRNLKHCAVSGTTLFSLRQ